MPSFLFRASIACASIAVASCDFPASSIDAPSDGSISMMGTAPSTATLDSAVIVTTSDAAVQTPPVANEAPSDGSVVGTRGPGPGETPDGMGTSTMEPGTNQTPSDSDASTTPPDTTPPGDPPVTTPPVTTPPDTTPPSTPPVTTPPVVTPPVTTPPVTPPVTTPPVTTPPVTTPPVVTPPVVTPPVVTPPVTTPPVVTPPVTTPPVVTPPVVTPPVTTTPGRALHGVYHWDAPPGPSNVDAFATWSGQKIEVASAYAPIQTWQTLHDLNWQMSAWSRWVKAVPGRRLIYAMPLLTEAGDTLAACAQGAYDTHFAAVGAQLVDAGLGNAIVRLGWEWDGDWMRWSSRGKEAEYAGCFRSAATAMRNARPSGTLKFDWTASDDIFMRTPAQLAAAYPGDAYVDVIGVNAYDASWVASSYPIRANCDDACKAARRLTAWNDLVRGLNFGRDLAKQKGKVMSIPEWGLWDRADKQDGDDNADYIERIHSFVSDPNNNVLYQVYFDVKYVDGDHQISPLEGRPTQFPNAAAKYRQVFGAD